jgi:hypothetical protein
MRRTSLLPLLLPLLLAAPATAKPAAATIKDPKGDWAVASEDVLAARLEGLVAKGAKTLHATVTLAAAPDAATTYYVAFVDGVCNSWELSVQGLGTQAQRAVLTRYTCGDSTDAASVVGESVAVTAVAHGTTVEFSAPYALGLRHGTKVDGLLAAAAVRYASWGVGMDSDTFYTDGDIARGNSSYVLP